MARWLITAGLFRSFTTTAKIFFTGDVPREIERHNAAMRVGDASAMDRAYFEADGGDAVLRALERYYPFS